MSYTAKLTYPIYDLNSSDFLGLIVDVLKAEFAKQITTYTKTFLPVDVKKDEYLLNPVSDKEINPAFCSVIKAKMDSTEQRFADQQNEDNTFIIGILADGLENLRKIADTIYIILNDMDVKHYFFLYENALGDKLISDSGKYKVANLSTDYEVSKALNDKNIVYGFLTLNAEIAEVPKLNTYTEIEELVTEFNLGENETKLTQKTDLT